MSKVLAWIRSILCFLCFFQVFLQLTPKESYRKYLKFFGNLILVLLLLRPAASLLGQAESLEQFLKFQTLSNEYSELRMHMEGMEELKNTLVEKTFRREIEADPGGPGKYGYSVLSLSVSYGETGEPEAIDLVLLSSKDEGTAKIQKAFKDLWTCRRRDPDHGKGGVKVKEQLEKWKEMLKTGGKNRWAVFLLAGLLLLVISLPTGEGKSAPVLRTEAADEKSVSQAEELAERLEKVLSRVSGVGKTKVLVTLKSDGKRLVEKDSTTREDSSESRDQEENTVYEKNGSGQEKPYVSETMEPEVSGVLVAAQEEVMTR